MARLNDYVQSLQRDIQFSFDPEMNQPIVRVVERGSQELIRQIPSETAIKLARSLKEMSDLGEVKAIGLAGEAGQGEISLFRAQA